MTWTFCLHDRTSTLHALNARLAEFDDVFWLICLTPWLSVTLISSLTTPMASTNDEPKTARTLRTFSYSHTPTLWYHHLYFADYNLSKALLVVHVYTYVRNWYKYLGNLGGYLFSSTKWLLSCSAGVLSRFHQAAISVQGFFHSCVC